MERNSREARAAHRKFPDSPDVPPPEGQRVEGGSFGMSRAPGALRRGGGETAAGEGAKTGKILSVVDSISGNATAAGGIIGRRRRAVR